MKNRRPYKMSCLVFVFFLIPFCVLAADSIIYDQATAEEKAKIDEELKGYKVEFSYDLKVHKKEREVAYDFFMQDPDCDDKDIPCLHLRDIGIDLYDVNGDGKQDVLAYYNYSGSCGSAGCSFSILLQQGDSYVRAALSDSATSITVYHAITISHHKTHGFHDLIYEGWGNTNVWKWNQRHYSYYLKIINDINTPQNQNF